MSIKKQAFSIVEIIITVSIIVLLAVIGFSSKLGYDENVNNSKIVSEIKTIDNALELYLQENSKLPMPDGNVNFYSKDTSYIHSYDDKDTFGVYGSITENTIPKKYLDVTPFDTRTNSYYSYGKTKSKNEYEIASVQMVDFAPKSNIIGNYSAEKGPYNLIREYNGPNFVYNKSKTNFPYNPYELKLTAKIANISGTVEIETSGGELINDNDLILNYDLQKGDKINVEIGSNVQIHFSDGSVSVIGDNNQPTNVTLSDMNFRGENNLNTFIKLYLKAGSIWTKATKLNDNSDFEIYTTDLNAAVRGTIFSVTKDSISTKVIVEKGSIDIYKNGKYIETITANLGDIIKKLEFNDSINEIQEIDINEISKPDFINSTDIRSDETVNNVIKVNSPNTPSPTEPEPSTPSPTVPIEITGNGCGQCPNGYTESGTNRAGLSCGTFRGERNERYCNDVIGNDSLTVICETEKKVGTGFFAKCNGWTKKSWTGIYND